MVLSPEWKSEESWMVRVVQEQMSQKKDLNEDDRKNQEWFQRQDPAHRKKSPAVLKEMICHDSGALTVVHARQFWICWRWIIWHSVFHHHHHHHTTAVLRPFFRDHPGEPVPEENFWTLWCKGRLTEADTPTIRLGATPSRLTSAHLHHPTHMETVQVTPLRRTLASSP